MKDSYICCCYFDSNKRACTKEMIYYIKQEINTKCFYLHGIKHKFDFASALNRKWLNTSIIDYIILCQYYILMSFKRYLAHQCVHNWSNKHYFSYTSNATCLICWGLIRSYTVNVKWRLFQPSLVEEDSIYISVHCSKLKQAPE